MRNLTTTVMLAILAFITAGCHLLDIDLFSGPEDLGSGKGTANCYVITKPGTFKFKAVKGNSQENLSAVTAEVLWETWNNAEDVTHNSVIASTALQNGYVVFSTPEVLKPGNAVIAARDAGGVIVWSWHIWVPASDISVDNHGVYGVAMMDRNLGALVPATTDGPAPVESFGLTYQWGRKDPFVGPQKANSGNNATVAGTAISVAQTQGPGDARISLDNSIQRPTLIGYSQNGDWVLSGDPTFWQDDEKTIYDPCPPGYRVPACDKTQYLHGEDLSVAPGWTINMEQYWFALGKPLAVFPFAGYRDDYSPGGLTHSYDRSLMWTTTSSTDEKAYCVNVRGGYTQVLGEAPKARAGSVRCVSE